jgi:hypothetical protein
MKTFYTERDIVDLHATGVRQLEIDDDMVLTDLAREKAQELGIALVTSSHQPSSPVSSLSPVLTPHLSQPELAAHIKARVIARLGTDEYNDILDRVIPQVLNRLTVPDQADQTTTSSRAY